jgi:hypothetical protein
MVNRNIDQDCWSHFYKYSYLLKLGRHFVVVSMLEQLAFQRKEVDRKKIILIFQITVQLLLTDDKFFQITVVLLMTDDKIFK